MLLLFLVANLCAVGWTTLYSCCPMTYLVVTLTKTVQWSPTLLWKESCVIAMIS